MTGQRSHTIEMTFPEMWETLNALTVRRHALETLEAIAPEDIRPSLEIVRRVERCIRLVMLASDDLPGAPDPVDQYKRRRELAAESESELRAAHGDR